VAETARARAALRRLRRIPRELADRPLAAAVRAHPLPEWPDRLGAPSRALLERLDAADLAELRARVEPDLQAVWDATGPVSARHLALILGAHYEVAPILERTGLRPDVPPEDVHAMGRGPLAAGGDFWLADLLADAAERAGAPLVPGARVLDFGCSSGRHLRVLQAWQPEVEWLGCDPNEAAVGWAGEHLTGIEFFASPQDPPLPLAAGSLDAALAVSVWSHFSAAAAVRWWEEMHRLLRPGGLLVFTIQGLGSVAHYLRTGAVDDEYAARAARSLLGGGHHYIDIFGPTGDWGVASPDWGIAYMTLEWLAERTLSAWTLELHEATRVDTNQDLVVLRRR